MLSFNCKILPFFWRKFDFCRVNFDRRFVVSCFDDFQTGMIVYDRFALNLD